MNARTEGTFASFAAVLVLFSAMWDPRISVAMAVVALATTGIYGFCESTTSRYPSLRTERLPPEPG